MYEESENGGVQEYSVSSQHGTWEILFNNDYQIETIFLNLDCGCRGVLGITKAMKRADIIKLLGEPTKSGEKGFILILKEEFGSWERYDRNDYCIHIEHSLDNRGTKKITIMLPSIAP